jgi:hypothetical protein
VLRIAVRVAQAQAELRVCTHAREQRDELAAEVHHERRWQQLDPENAAVEWLGQGIPLEGQRRAN